MWITAEICELVLCSVESALDIAGKSYKLFTFFAM